MFCAMQPEGRKFESTSSHCVATLEKLLAHNCLCGRQLETISLISSPGGVKSSEPAFGQRTIIIINVALIIKFIHCSSQFILNLRLIFELLTFFTVWP